MEDDNDDLAFLDVFNQPFASAILRAVEEVQNYAQDTIDHFDYLIRTRLQTLVSHANINVSIPPSPSGFSHTQRHCLVFSRANLQPPTVPTIDGLARGMRVLQVDAPRMFPHEALLRGLTYSSGVFVDIHYEIWNGEPGAETLESSTDFVNVPFFQLPIPLYSKSCNLSDPEMRRKKEACVDPDDKGGYFIIRGLPKTIQPQKVQRNNIVLVRQNPKGWLEAVIRSIRSDEKDRSTSTLPVYFTQSTSALTVDIPYLAKNQTVLAAFRLLGFHTRQEIEYFVFHQPSDHVEPSKLESAQRIFASNFSSFRDLFTCSMEDLIVHMGSCVPNAKTLEFSRMERIVKQQVAGELLPHCGFLETPAIHFKKALFLGIICRRLLFVHLGIETSDDRDFEGYKCLQLSSSILGTLLRQLITNFSKTLRKRIFDKVKRGESFRDPDSLILHMDALPGLIEAFVKGEVVIQKDASNSATEVIQLINPVNPLSVQSHMQRIRIPLPNSGKYPQCRSLNPFSWGSICPIKTPEGEGAGLLQNLTILSRVSLPVTMKDLTLQLLSLPGVEPLDYDAKINQEDYSKHYSLVLLNSEPIGRTRNAEALLDLIRHQRRGRDGLLPSRITAVLFPYGVMVFSDMGIITFPLFHLPSLYKVKHAIAESELGGRNLWRCLEDHGVVEYVDALEALDYSVLLNLTEIRKHAAERTKQGKDIWDGYTHMFPHSSGFLSTAAGTIPFPDHNQAPRNAYQAGMAEQAISSPFGYTVFERDEANYRNILNYPQQPICTTQVAEAKGLNHWPMGVNAIVAIAPYFTSEDAITFCQASGDFGMLGVTLLRSFRAVAKGKGSDVENFEHPQHTPTGAPKCIGIRGECDYSKLGIDGLPLPGTWLKHNDVLIGRTGKMQEVGPDGEMREIRRCRSVVLTCDPSEVHRVVKVMVSDNKDSCRIVRVVTSTPRKVQCGDKLSSRHGQKGTVGTMLRAEDMPFVMSGPNAGMRPDIIINLQCISGRMTLGKLMECLYGSLGVVTGQIQDASPFFDVNAKWAIDELLKHGYSDEYTMCSGTTGEIFDQKWFLGTCFYQRLNHHVLQKIAARARGPLATLTRQPVDGRTNIGGQKMGEMEFDAFRGAGAAYGIRDAGLVRCDLFKTQICIGCGEMGQVIKPSLAALGSGEGMVCRACHAKNKSVDVDFKYAYAGLLKNEVGSCGILIRHQFSKEALESMKEEIQESQEMGGDNAEGESAGDGGDNMEEELN
jgi:DNA-directed RNA polymerase II subunit RPB2